MEYNSNELRIAFLLSDHSKIDGCSKEHIDSSIKLNKLFVEFIKNLRHQVLYKVPGSRSPFDCISVLKQFNDTVKIYHTAKAVLKIEELINLIYYHNFEWTNLGQVLKMFMDMFRLLDLDYSNEYEKVEEINTDLIKIIIKIREDIKKISENNVISHNELNGLYEKISNKYLPECGISIESNQNNWYYKNK